MAFSLIWTVASGVLCSAFIVEISDSSGLHWSRCLQAPTFYALIGLSILVFLHTRAIYQHETSVERFLDDSYCKAYMRSQCLPEAAQKYKELIRSGQVGELEKAMNEFRRSLK